MTVKLDLEEEEYGKVDLDKVVERTVEDLFNNGNPMERMAAAERLLYVDVHVLQERIQAVGYRLRRFGHPRFVKEYPGKEKIVLPEPLHLSASLSDVIKNRRSRKMFSEEGLDLAQLSTILYHCYGTTHKRRSRMRDHPFIPFRAAPTSGGLSGEEIYILAMNVKGLPQGIYHYNGVEHTLDVLFEGFIETKVQMIWSLPETLKNASCFFAYTIDLRRGAWKYHARYLRTALLDSGGIMGYAVLASVALGLHANPLTGFNPERLAELLRIDGLHEVPALTMAFGRPGTSSFDFEPGEPQ
ncbi:MAG: SagB/ThcOx family dehydrogenase [Methanobacteriota archaeon]